MTEQEPLVNFAYWNQNTGQIARSDEPNPRLELLDNWHPIDPAVADEDAPKPPLGGGVFRPVELPYIPPPPAPAAVPAREGEQTPAELPNKSASKTDWVTYAVNCGMAQADAEALTRDQLAERFTAMKETS